MNKISKIQYVSQGKTWDEQVNNINNALKHGIDWIQLRWKEASKEEVFDLARLAKVWCQSYQAKLIINDHVDIAKAINADGVHLGLKDMAITSARKLLGENKIYGGTANTLTDILQRIDEKCDYIGLGPFRFTATKQELSPILGLEGYGSIIEELNILSINPPPILAIGGISAQDISALQGVGVYGVAMSKSISDNPSSISILNTLV